MADYILDIEVFNEPSDNETFHSGKYLVHGYDDVLWTDSIDDAVNYLKNDLKRLKDQEPL